MTDPTVIKTATMRFLVCFHFGAGVFRDIGPHLSFEVKKKVIQAIENNGGHDGKLHEVFNRRKLRFKNCRWFCSEVCGGPEGRPEFWTSLAKFAKEILRLSFEDCCAQVFHCGIVKRRRMVVQHFCLHAPVAQWTTKISHSDIQTML